MRMKNQFVNPCKTVEMPAFTDVLKLFNSSA